MPNPILNKRGLFNQSRSNYDPNANAYFNKLAQVGPAPSLFFKKAINTLVIDLKGNGTVGSHNNWQYIDYLPIFATEYQAHAVIDLSHPARTAAIEVNSPIWTQFEGYTGDGVATYINTNYNPSSGPLTPTNICHLIYNRTNSFNVSSSAGVRDANIPCEYTVLSAWVSGDIYVGIGSNEINTAIANPQGLIGGVRSGTINASILRNGVILRTSALGASGSQPNYNDFILAYNAEGHPDSFDDRQISLRLWATDGVDQLSLYNAIQAFATTIGFNV